LLKVNPRIVHFSGHGTIDGLVFENQERQTHIVNPEALADLFKLFAGKVECVLLNSCYSAPQAEAISKHINYVIGVTNEISDKAAIEFAVGFYDALGAGWPIEEAYRVGCSALRLEGLPQHLEPVLHVKSQRRPTRVQKSPAQAARPTMERHPGAARIFYSYSQKDERLLGRLEQHLTLLQREGLIEEWHNRKVTASQEWQGELDAHLNSAQIILLLVSPNFLASDYINDKEIKRAMERHESGEAYVIPIILRPSDWQNAPFSQLEPLPKNGKPITKWANRDEAFLDVADGIRAALKALSHEN
jgi:hypothetical protein